jgi:ABC-type sugar transport system ATPase subunit
MEHVEIGAISPPPRAADPVPALRVQDVAKAFGATQALRSCSFELRQGEIHALVGENGSGKSTLVKILAGVHRPDDGTIQVGGLTMTGLRNPRAALDAGVATVFQEVLVVGAQSVLDNVWLGADGVFRERVPKDVKRRRAAEVLTELLGTEPELDAPVETLSLSDRQACGIARALVREPRVLVLDEATSALDIATRDRLFAMIARLREDGTATIFISHRMDEIEEVCDRITVLRSGETVTTLPRAEADGDLLVRLMTGAGRLTAGAPTEERVLGETALRVRGLRLRPEAKPIDLEVRAGELVGLAGLEGHGQDAFLRALWEGPPLSGEVLRVGDGREVPVRSRTQAAAHGIAYVPRDRRGEALFGPLSVAENFSVVTMRRDLRGGLLSHRGAAHRLAPYIDRLGIRLSAGTDPITTLSGGNQQKVIMARWLATDPRVLLLNDPTRGVDLGAKRDLYALLTGLATDGVATVMLSTEVDEHIELMDRVLVFREGEVCAEIPRDGLNRHALVSSFFGGSR